MKEINKKLLDKNKQFTILKKLNLTNKKFIDIFFEGTRDDKNIDIYECKKTGCLFLSKVKTNLDYYKKKNGYFRDFQDYKNNKYKDDKRRSDFIKKNFRNKSLLDVGAGTGQFADLVFKSLKEITLVEPDNYLSKRLKKTYTVYDIVDHVDNKFDIITLYHVLEHIDNPLEFLSTIKKKLKNKGKVIIEVPHANDVLIKKYNLNSFKKHTFWSEHIFLYTEDVLKKMLLFLGFKKISISYIQRYDLENHINWMLKDKNTFFENNILNFYDNTNYKLNNQRYINYLIKNKLTDTISIIGDNG